jgi:hypothetical protein
MHSVSCYGSDFLFVSRAAPQGAITGNTVDTRNQPTETGHEKKKLNTVGFSVKWNWSQVKLQLRCFTNCTVKADNSLRISH